MYNFITDENAKLREKLIKFFIAHKNGYFDIVYLSSYFSIPKDKLRINLNKLAKKEYWKNIISLVTKFIRMGVNNPLILLKHLIINYH